MTNWTWTADQLSAAVDRANPVDRVWPASYPLVRTLREQEGLSQAQVSSVCRVSKRTLERFEHGHPTHLPRNERFAKLVALLLEQASVSNPRLFWACRDLFYADRRPMEFPRAA